MNTENTGYLQIARVGGAIFVVLQQIILIDIAYNWNDAWVQNGEVRGGGGWVCVCGGGSLRLETL